MHIHLIFNVLILTQKAISSRNLWIFCLDKYPKSLFQSTLKPFFLFLFILSASLGLRAQDAYWVYFKDKVDTHFCAKEYFSEKGLLRRQKHRIETGDYYDLPVSEEYIRKVAPFSDSILVCSRWLNAIAIRATPEARRAIEILPFVRSMEPCRTLTVSGRPRDSLSFPDRISREDSLLLRFQLSRMKGQEFRKRHLDGSGITIAVFDVGFKGADRHPAFRHLFKRGAIKATWDFIGRDTQLFDRGTHGTMVLGCLAGYWDSIPMGLATGADYLLARTERAHLEITFEEYSWIAAAEWADRQGADIISSSLGYSDQRYFQEEMTGRKAPISHAANVAASKGILVINAAGNEARNRWGTLVAPADADSVLTVGAVDPRTDVAFEFSSPGPTSDGRLKPNVVNLGIAFTAMPGKYGTAEGTSFATPLTAGFAACAWQAYPQKRNMDIFHLIEYSGHLYPYFDYHHGYGIPQATRALGLARPVEPTFHFNKTDAYLEVEVDPALLPEKDDKGQLLSRGRNLFYKIVQPDGRIRKYGVVLAEIKEPVYFELDDLSPGETVVVHFEGYTQSYTIQ